MPPFVGPVTIASALATIILTTGCGRSSCADTDLTVTSVTASPNTPLVLQATLTTDDRPVPGADITFYSKVTGGEPASAGGYRIGSAKTDSQGIARFDLPLGVKHLELLSGERAVGYNAEFKPLNKIGGTSYCRGYSRHAEIRRV